jgi:hypothetical protein
MYVRRASAQNRNAIALQVAIIATIILIIFMPLSH